MNIVVSVNVEYVVRHDIYYQRENIFLYHLIFYDDSILYLLTDLQEVFSSGSRIIGNYRFHLELTNLRINVFSGFRIRVLTTFFLKPLAELRRHRTKNKQELLINENPGKVIYIRCIFGSHLYYYTLRVLQLCTIIRTKQTWPIPPSVSISLPNLSPSVN